jgi:hypothetical protein
VTDRIEPVGPRRDVEPVRRVLLAPVQREAEKRERERRRRRPAPRPAAPEDASEGGALDVRA